jgi:hypothetical protein
MQRDMPCAGDTGGCVCGFSLPLTVYVLGENIKQKLAQIKHLFPTVMSTSGV